MSATITFSCGHCRSTLTVPASLAGVSGPCPICGQTITSPAAEPPPPAPAPSAAPAPEPILRPRTESVPLPAVAPAPVEPRQPVPWGNPFPEPAARPARPATPAARDPRDGKSPVAAYTLAVLLILGGVGAAAWHFFRPFFDRTPLPEAPALSAPADRETKDHPAAPAGQPPVAAEMPESSPAAPVVAEAPVVAPPVDDSPAPSDAGSAPPADTAVVPVPGPAPVAPNAPGPMPEPAPVPTPGAIAVEEVVPPLNPTAVPAMEESMVKQFQARLDAFFKAATPEDRVPLLFSEIESDAQLADSAKTGTLAKLPPLEYKAVLAFDGPRQGISQYYVAVTNKSAEDEAPNREILLHLANHGNQPFRVNADALRFQLEKQLPAFLGNPKADALRAFVFIERAHFFANAATETPRGHLCVNLRLGPYTPIVGQALVDLGTEAGLEMTPLANWGDSPKAVVVTLRHAVVGGMPAVVVDAFHCGNWLAAYPKADPNPGGN